MIRGNVSNRDNAAAFLINGYDAAYHRGVVDATLTGNTVIDNGTTGNFLLINGAAQGVTLTDNLYVAPALQYGTAGTSPVCVQNQTDLSSFTRIADNVWPAALYTHLDRGGENFIGPYWAMGYQTTTQWLSYPQVKNDQFKNMTLPQNFATNVLNPGMTWDKLLAA